MSPCDFTEDFLCYFRVTTANTSFVSQFLDRGSRFRVPAMAAPDKRPSGLTSHRRYISFKNPNRVLHQSVHRWLDVRQWVYESARVFDCQNGEGKIEHWGPGWLCATVVQSPDSGSSGTIQGCMSLDIAISEERVDNMFFQGNVVCNKTVSSVATSPAPDGSSGALLLTIMSDGTMLQVTRVEHGAGIRTESEDVIDTTPLPTTAGTSFVTPSVFPVVDEKRREKEKSHDEERRKKFESMNGSIHSRDRTSGTSSSSSGTSSGGGSSSSSSSSSSSKQKERRRQEEECK